MTVQLSTEDSKGNKSLFWSYVEIYIKNILKCQAKISELMPWYEMNKKKSYELIMELSTEDSKLGSTDIFWSCVKFSIITV